MSTDGYVTPPVVAGTNVTANPLWFGTNSSIPPGSDVMANASNVTEVDIEALLLFRMGARSRSAVELTVLTLVYSIIFVTGLIGNVSTCIVIRKNSYMRTATNYYLFSLAISDVLTLILGLPAELYTIWNAYPWVFGETFCVFKTFLSETTTSASVLTITAFTVERYVAICHPIRSQTMSNLSRAIKIIIVIWILACAASIPYPIHVGTFYFVFHPVTEEPIPDSLQCNIKFEYFDTMKYMFQLTAFILFFVPMCIITILYVLIGLTLRRSGMVRRSIDNTPASSSPSGPSQSRRAILKMLVAVVVAFFICWAPFHAQRLMTALVPDDEWEKNNTLIEIQSVLFYISGVLYFVSSTVNPILYNLMSRKYRQAFKETMCRCCMSLEERRQIRDGRGRIFSERSTSAATVGHTCHTAKLLPHKHTVNRHAGHKHCKTAAGSPASSSLSDSTTESSISRKWGSIKKRLLPKMKVPRNGRAVCGRHGREKSPGPTANGSVCSSSRASVSESPLHANAIKEELELDDVGASSPVLDRDYIHMDGDGQKGTFL